MPEEIIQKKLDQMKQLLRELNELFNKPRPEFLKDVVVVRAAERDFQLIVDLASDINTHILIERGKETPDTYRQSFIDIEREGILSTDLAQTLAASARLRNILVHEYDFEEDYERFYESVKQFIPAYQEYIKKIYGIAQK